MKPLAYVVLLLIFASCPTRPNERYCAEGVPCSNPSFSFCDEAGIFAGVPNHCINIDDRACSVHAECTTESIPICDPALVHCRICQSSEECSERNADKPVCEPDGQCSDNCNESADCPDAQPICSSERRCQACTSNVECEDRGTDKPFCGPEPAGVCVECRGNGDCTSAAAAICTAGVCSPCTAHSQCEASNVCDRAQGICVPESNVFYVQAGTAGAGCTREEPCATIGEAFDQVVSGNAKNVIRVLGNDTYIDPLPNDITKSVAIIGEGARLQGNTGSYVVTIGGRDTTVSLQGLDIKGEGTASGIFCSSSDGSTALNLFDMTISSDKQGLVASQCTVNMASSKVELNDNGGIRLTDCSFNLVNNFITNNGTGAQGTFGGVQITNTQVTLVSSEVFAFNTVVFNQNRTKGSADGVACEAVTSDALFVGNIVYDGADGENPAITANAPCRKWQFSNIQRLISITPPPGSNNIDEQPEYRDKLGNDYRLVAGSPGIDSVPRATPGVDVVVTDREGDSRPQGTSWDMGADEVIQAGQ